jgi:hypothetical protein
MFLLFKSFYFYSKKFLFSSFAFFEILQIWLGFGSSLFLSLVINYSTISSLLLIILIIPFWFEIY